MSGLFVLNGWYVGVLVVTGWHVGVKWVVCWWRMGGVLVMGRMFVVNGWYVGGTFMVSRSCVGGMLVVREWYSSTFDLQMFQFHFGGVHALEIETFHAVWLAPSPFSTASHGCQKGLCVKSKAMRGGLSRFIVPAACWLGSIDRLRSLLTLSFYSLLLPLVKTRTDSPEYLEMNWIFVTEYSETVEEIQINQFNFHSPSTVE